MIVPLSEIITSLESGVSVNGDDVCASEHEFGVLKVSCISDGRFFSRENKRIFQEEMHRVSGAVKKGDLLISRANTFELVGACGLVDRDYSNLFLPDKIWRVVLAEDQRDYAPWLKHVLNSPEVRQELKRRATGTSGSMKNIPQTSFLTIPVFRPERPVQIAIANLLDSWDRGIQQLSDLIAAKVRFKQGLMQQLLTGKKRFPGFDEEWKHQSIGSFLVESRVSGSNGSDARKITVKLYGKGVLSKRDARAGSPSTKYYRRKTGQFIYSKLDFLNGAFGIIPPELEGFESTLDLPCFDIDRSVDPDWFLSFVCREDFYKSQLGLANGGRKARRVNPSEFLNITVPVPSPREQRRISAVLKLANNEINLLLKNLDSLKAQKKSLMQKLLTGQICVESHSGRV